MMNLLNGGGSFIIKTSQVWLYISNKYRNYIKMPISINLWLEWMRTCADADITLPVLCAPRLL